VDEGILVFESETVELRTCGESGVAVGISEPVAVAETVELRVSEGPPKLSGVAVVVGPP